MNLQKNTIVDPVPIARASVASRWACLAVPVLLCCPTQAQVCSPQIGTLSGVNHFVRSLAVLPSGDLIAGGFFTQAETGQPLSFVGRWDGTTWSPLGSGTNSTVSALVVLPDGSLVAGGNFNTAGGITASSIARWNGSAWSPLGAGLNGEVSALAITTGGDLIAGGTFTSSATVPLGNIARWDGTEWHPLGSGVSGGVDTILALPNGDLIVGGLFSSAGGLAASNIARWDGAAWQAIGAGMNSRVRALAQAPDGDLVAGGAFNVAGGVPAEGIARWNGSDWMPLGDGLQWGSVNAVLVRENGDIFAAGGFTASSMSPRNRVALWRGDAWQALGSGVGSLPEDQVLTAIELPNGSIAAGGNFHVAFSQAGSRLVECRLVEPDISVHPQSTTACPGASVSLVVNATGSLLTYQWRRNGSDVVGANSPSLHLADVSVEAAGVYDCVVSNSCGDSLTNPATLTIASRQIVAPPSDQHVNVDQPVFFTIETDVSSPCDASLAFQWQRRNPLVENPDAPGAWIDLADGGGFLGTRSRILGILRPTPGLATGYRCTIANACGCEGGGTGVIVTDPVNFSAACPSDFNNDGSVDGDDVIEFFLRWDSGC